MSQPVLDAISDHANGDVRIKAVHLLACAGQPEVADQLRELAVKDGMREDVKTALLEALYKLEQENSQEVPTESADEVDSPSVETSEEATTPELSADFEVAMMATSTNEAETPESLDSSHQFEFAPTLEVAALEEIEE